MKVHYVKAMIERDAVEKIPVCVLATEIPVLQMVHKGKLADVAVQDEFMDIDPAGEYDRLEMSYGMREGVGRSFAEEVYGSAHGLERRMSLGEDAPASEDTPEDADPENGDVFGGDEEAEPQKSSRKRS